MLWLTGLGSCFRSDILILLGSTEMRLAMRSCPILVDRGLALGRFKMEVEFSLLLCRYKKGLSLLYIDSFI